ncbi:MAG: helix-turn-helix transcriptional regulator [Fibrobacter sp.]|nr:helix-turn-helix transcriptional regulator [Candidatus Saccharibacteria bacterium]MCQ2121373.1 helix-turn-helix transcriptional regulator [Fibrobacter sp.]
MDMKELSKIVKSRRKELGITQADAAGMCGVGNRFLSELENGKESLHIGKVLHVLAMLGIDIALNTRG